MTTRELVRKVRNIEIRTRGAVNELFSGEYHSAFKGRGIEFSEVREYVPGDEVRTIDWNVTAREGKPFVKLFEEERELNVMLLVDVSASGEFGTVTSFKREMAAEIAGVLAFSAMRNQDKVGLVLFSDRVEQYLPPKGGTRHALRIVRDLLAWEPVGRGTDLASGLETLLRGLHKRSIVFLISDFQDSGIRPDGRGLGVEGGGGSRPEGRGISFGWQRAAKVAAAKHDLVAVHIIDPRERELPNAGWLPAEDPETGEVVWLDTTNRTVRDLYHLERSRRERLVGEFCNRNNIDRVVIDLSEPDQPYLRPLVRFFKKRERQR